MASVKCWTVMVAGRLVTVVQVPADFPLAAIQKLARVFWFAGDTVGLDWGEVLGKIPDAAGGGGGTGLELPTLGRPDT
jgi:hypothetical protein